MVTVDTQNRQGSSQKCILMHWTKNSVRSVPMDPLAAKRQTVHPDNQRKKTLRRLLRYHRGLTALQRTPNQWSQRHVLRCFLLFFLATSNPFSFGCSFRGSSVTVSLWHSSSLVLELCAPHQRSSLPNMTWFSNPGRSSFRIGLASNFSAPPTGCVTLSRFDYGEGSFLGE